MQTQEVQVKPSRTFKKYERILKEAVFIEEREIISFRSFLRRCSDQERHDLLELLGNREEALKITAPQAAKGLAWLNNLRLTPKGKERKRNPFGPRNADILDHFSHFTMPDLEDVGTYCPAYLPVYRVHSTTGLSFDYTAGCHQGATPGIEIR